MVNIQYNIVKGYFEKMGFPIEEKPFKVNLLGIRNAHVAGKYSDTMCCFFTNKNGDIYWRQYPCSTVPTGYWLLHPMQKAGCAVVAEGHHPHIWVPGLHKGKYPGLLQTGGDIIVYRDNSKDLNIDLDPKTKVKGRFGVNLHPFWNYADQAKDQSSAGCQVLDKAHVAEILECCKLDKQVNKTTAFSYTLIKSEEFQAFIQNEFNFKNFTLR